MKYSLVFIFLLSAFSSFAQGEDDHINWNFQKYAFKLNETWKMEITPIWRLNKNFSNHQNTSLDYKISRPIGHGLSIGLLGRSWFIPDQSLRQFVWLDLTHQMSHWKAPVKMKQRLMFHGGLDINERNDGENLRYLLNFTGKFNNSPVQPLFAIEPFFRFNGLNYIERFRTEFGFNWKADDKLNFIVFLRKEDWYNFDETYTLYLWMTGITYTFKKQLFNRKENALN